MNCPHCGSAERMAVKDTRATPDGRITRRRRCPDCFHDFVTVERLSETDLNVEKWDGRVVAFSRDAVRTGIEKAAVRRYEEDELLKLVDDVVSDVYRAAEGPIPSASIGASVLRLLRELDEVSHIRFALVHTGRRDRDDPTSGWRDVTAVRRWLIEEYPQLKYYRPPPGLAKVIKRDGRRVLFDRKRLEESIAYSSKGRGSRDEVRELAIQVASEVEHELGDQPLVTTSQIAAEILRILRRTDHIAYLRYASTAKDFKSPEDYEAEAVALRHVEMA